MTMSDTFQPGDVVRLKSGGLPMTVVSPRGPDVEVVWLHTDGAIESAAVPAACLMAVQSPPVAGQDAPTLYGTKVVLDEPVRVGPPELPPAGVCAACRLMFALTELQPHTGGDGKTVELLCDSCCKRRLFVPPPEQPVDAVVGTTEPPCGVPVVFEPRRCYSCGKPFGPDRLHADTVYLGDGGQGKVCEECVKKAL
jgi:uncharacterized protein YodC (DUF2158 family)